MGNQFRFELITPDGESLYLSPPDFIVELPISEGIGLPPLAHATQEIYQQPGALLKSLKINPRVVTISTTLNAGCRSRLHELRQRLWNALRWNRTLVPEPCRLRYTTNGHSADLYVYYAGDVWSNIGGSDNAGLVGIKLIAYDPMWHAVDETIVHATSAPYWSASVSYAIGKIGGIWNAMGNAGTGDVYCIAVSPDGNTIYFGGTFINWNGIPNADKIVAYDVTAGTWSALGVGADDYIADMVISADGTLYVVGKFNNIGGLVTSGVARWNGIAWSALGTGLTGLGADGFAIAIGPDGSIYVGGAFDHANGVAASCLAKWNGTTFVAFGVGADNIVTALAVSPENILYIGGSFANIGGVAATKIASYNGTTFAAMGTGASDVPRCITVHNGIVYVGGDFLTLGGITVNYIGQWNGTVWSALGSGMNSIVYEIRFDSNGILYAGGFFTLAGGVALSDRAAQWNGSVWTPLDIDLPGAPVVYAIDVTNDLYLGFTTSGTATGSSSTMIAPVVSGDADVYPIFTITGPGTLQFIENIYTAKKMLFYCTLNAGETATIDLTPGIKTFSSDWRGDLLPFAALLPVSDFGTFALSPDPIAPSGANAINIYMSSTTPVEQNDGSNQLSGWGNITGVSAVNTGSGGRLWVSIVSDGAGFYHVDFYKDSAKAAADLVGHTATYNGAGAKAMVANNASGLGGTITVDAVIGADSDIIAFFNVSTIEYYNLFLSADAAVQ